MTPFLISGSLIYLVLGYLALAQPLGQYDTGNLVEGAQAALSCIGSGQWAPCPGTWHYGGLQYFVSAPLLALGMGKAGVLRFLVFASWVATGMGVWGTWRILAPRGTAVRALGLGAFLVGSPYLYARTSFVEPWAMALNIGVILHALTPQGGREILWLFVSAALASMSKETAPPLVFILGAWALFVRWSEGRPDLRRVGALVAGCLTGLATNLAFAYFRFGVPYNATQLDPRYRVPGFGQQLEYWAGLWVSPNGGMMFFWPLATICLVLVVWIAVGKVRALVPIGILAAITLGLSGWYAPYGWIAWGPRLCLPWIMPLVALALRAHGAELWAKLGPSFAKPALIGALAVGGVALSVPQMAAAFHPEIVWRLFDNTPSCPRPAHVETEPDFYYHCMSDYQWVNRWPLWDAWGEVFSDSTLLAALLVAGAVIAWLLGLRRLAPATASAESAHFRRRK